MTKLEGVVCGNQTALRDAIALGIGRMLDLKRHLTKIGAFDHNFLHIVLTDGEDNKSKIEEGRFLALQHVLDRENFHKICVVGGGITGAVMVLLLKLTYILVKQ